MIGKLKTKQSGFTVVEILLALIFIAIVASIGVYVAHNHSTTTPAKTTTTTIPDPYANWKTYSATDFSLKYPADWNVKTGTFGQDHQVWGADFYVNPNSVPTTTKAFVNPPASYSTSNSYTIDIKEFAISTSDYLAYSNGIGYNQPEPYNYLKTSEQISSGIFRGKYLTFLSHYNILKNVTNKLPDQALVTNQSYDGSNGTMTEEGFVVIKDNTYQITINSNDAADGNGYPSVFNLSALKNTDLYKDTLLILNSIQ